MNPSRILIIDDNESIHSDFRVILQPETEVDEFADLHAEFLDLDAASQEPSLQYELDSAFQGEEGFEMVQEALRTGRPYAFAFIDMRMPPGWDGLETLKHIFDADPNIQAVICTAFSDRSWADFIDTVGYTDRLLILKKPFDNSEVSQIAAALSTKYELAHKASLRMDQLEAMVAERTAEIIAANRQREEAQQRQMEQERELLQKRKLESLGLLAGGVAHDVNNFLHIARASIDIANASAEACSDASPPTEQTTSAELRNSTPGTSTSGTSTTGTSIPDRLAVASSAIKDAAAIVSQILDFSRRETGAVVEIRPEQAIENSGQLLRPLLGTAVELRQDVSASLQNYSLHGDASSLEQILVNLCMNARDAMPDGGTITLRANVSEAPEDSTADNADGMLVVEVIDQGTGIPEELHDRILDPFFTTKEVGKGTGLGLSTVHAIVRRHQGAIEFESTVGSGTTFRVSLPLYDRNFVAPNMAGLDPESVRSIKQTNQLKVLVADDSPIIRELTRHILTSSGYRTIEAENGQEAVDIAAQHDDLALLVMDVQMPIMDGRRAASLINTNGRAIPVVFCSGFDPYEMDSAEDLPELPLPPISLRKPFDQVSLLNAVASALDLSADVA